MTVNDFLPCFRSFENPIKDAAFSHYEVQTVLQDDEGVFCEPLHSVKDIESALSAGNTVFVSIYGRYREGCGQGAECIGDFSTTERAITTLIRMGVPVNDA